MDGGCHIDVKPDSREVESQVCVDEQAGAGGRGVVAILRRNILLEGLKFKLKSRDLSIDRKYNCSKLETVSYGG